MRNIQNVRTCVVGGAGFLGSHLVDYLVEHRQCEVLALDNLCVGRRGWVHPKATFRHCDISTSEEHLRGLFKEHQIQYVFNYAAWPYIPDSFARPKHVFAVNASGAINVINAAQEAGALGILQVSSAEIYGEGYTGLSVDEEGHADGKIDKEAPIAPHSTYGAAKAAADYYCQSAWRERETPVIALRQFNCVGERETHPYVVPEIISQLSVCRENAERTKEPLDNCVAIVQLGNNSFRDFLYAGDAVRIAVSLLERGQFGEVYNLGSETGIKIYDLAKLIGKVMGFADVRVEVDEARKRPWEIWHLQSDNTKLATTLGFKRFSPGEGDGGMKGAYALIPLEEALKRTVEWYQSNGCKWGWER